jgi:hypothetical protein
MRAARSPDTRSRLPGQAWFAALTVSHFFPIARLALSAGNALLVSTLIAAVVLVATWLPARMAMAIEPRKVLWME